MPEVTKLLPFPFLDQECEFLKVRTRVELDSNSGAPKSTGHQIKNILGVFL